VDDDRLSGASVDERPGAGVEARRPVRCGGSGRRRGREQPDQQGQDEAQRSFSLSPASRICGSTPGFSRSMPEIETPVLWAIELSVSPGWTT
jgi:hypothetical protein